jgi:hypothetical protein
MGFDRGRTMARVVLGNGYYPPKESPEEALRAEGYVFLVSTQAEETKTSGPWPLLAAVDK